MLANVVRLVVPGWSGEELECLIVPHVTTGQVEEALEWLYIKLDVKQILQLLCPGEFEVHEVPTMHSSKVNNQKEMVDSFEENTQITEMLEVKLSSSDSMDEIKEEPLELAGNISEVETEQGRVTPEGSFALEKEKRKPYKTKCIHCDMYIKGKQAYRKHLKEFQKLEDKNIETEEAQCQICGKTLKHSQTLKNHIKEVHGDKTYTCTTCGISLSCQRNLTTHMITHSKPAIPCEQGGKLFK
jgi:hypothetical protein